MQESPFKNFVRQTYQSSSPLPYIITVAIGLFLLSHIVEIFNLSTGHLIQTELSIVPEVRNWIYQPWSLLSYPFVYSKLFPLVFDCLWLFWIGNMFLNILHKKYFFHIFFGALIYSGIAFLLLNNIQLLAQTSTPLTSMTNGIGSLLGAMIILSPKTEIRLLIIGNLTIKTIAFVYLGIELFSLLYSSQYTAAIVFVISVAFGVLFIKSFQKGNDWSMLFEKKDKRHLKVVHKQDRKIDTKIEAPNQETVDQLLDKISASGYESLSKSEKEILFKASKQN